MLISHYLLSSIIKEMGCLPKNQKKVLEVVGPSQIISLDIGCEIFKRNCAFAITRSWDCQ